MSRDDRLDALRTTLAQAANRYADLCSGTGEHKPTAEQAQHAEAHAWADLVHARAELGAARPSRILPAHAIQEQP